jgi:hypothetical protein
VILQLQLDASALSCYQYASEETSLHPDLATLTNNEALWRRPRIKTQTTFRRPGAIVARVAPKNVDWALVGDEAVLVFPGDTHRRADLVSYPSKAISKIDGGRGGGREREAEEESGESAPGTVMMRR